MRLATTLIFASFFSVLVLAPACGDKDDTGGDDGGAVDGGGEDGGTDGGTEDGGTDGGTEDGGVEDGGADGGVEDGGADGGTTDGGTTDGGTTDGGTTDGGTTDGGTTDGGTTDGGTTDGGTTDGGADGGSVREDCSNGIDDDGDGLVDCDDRDCVRSPDCVPEPEERDCSDGLDDDGDGLVDCEDDDCADDDACAPAETECADGLDDDGDGLVDCEDDDCRGTSDCPVECPDGDLGDELGDALASGTVTDADGDDFSGSCGGSGGVDLAFEWVAPEDGCYVVDTEDSDYDTVLRILDTCDGDELDCDDDGGDVGYTSMLQFAASAGDSLVIVLDAYSAGETGAYSLDIQTGGVDSGDLDGDLGSATGDGVATGTFDGTEDRLLVASCGSSGGDVVYSWTVPSTGTWVFDTDTSDMDTTLSLWEESGCEEYDCDDDGGSASLTSEITMDLVEGEVILVRVAAYSTYSTGSWTLDINAL